MFPRLPPALRTLLVLALLALAPAAAAHRVAVVYAAGVPAYAEAAGAFRETMEDAGAVVAAVVLPPTREALAHKLEVSLPDLIVTFGSAAAAAVATLPGETPVIAAMVLGKRELRKLAAQAPERFISAVTLDVPPAAALSRLKAAFPSRRRLVVVYNPGRSPVDEQDYEAAARTFGMTVTFVPCASPRCLLEAVASWRRRADFLWCLPDASLYPPASVAPLVLASVSSGLPIVGFSESFVGAGALAGFFPDQKDIGLQTARLARAFLDGGRLPVSEPPRTIHFAVNLRVVRLLGLTWREPDEPGVKVLR